MRTTKPISTISFNTPAFLKLKKMLFVLVSHFGQLGYNLRLFFDSGGTQGYKTRRDGKTKKNRNHAFELPINHFCLLWMHSVRLTGSPAPERQHFLFLPPSVKTARSDAVKLCGSIILQFISRIVSHRDAAIKKPRTNRRNWIPMNNSAYTHCVLSARIR